MKKIILFVFLSLIFIQTIFAQAKPANLFFSFLGRNVSQKDTDFKEKIYAQTGDEIEIKILLSAREEKIKGIILIPQISPSLIFLNDSLKIDQNFSSLNIKNGIQLGDLLPGENKEISFRVKVGEGVFDKKILISSLKILADNFNPKIKTFLIEIKQMPKKENFFKSANFIQAIPISINDPFSLSFLSAFFIALFYEIYFDLKLRVARFFNHPRRFIKTKTFLGNLRLFIYRFFYRKR